nr:PH domain-containing protein [Candidatus Woesearchaeota archaeon]
MNQLHPGARWQFRITGYFLFGIPGFFLSLWIIPFAILLFNSSIAGIILISYIVFVIIASEIYARLSYNRWFYEFTDEGLRLERGIIWKRYSNVPYERIQNIDVYRGIIARMFGFSSVLIQTAGYSGQINAEGSIPAVDINQAEKIRIFIMKKITNMRK